MADSSGLCTLKEEYHFLNSLEKKKKKSHPVANISYWHMGLYSLSDKPHSPQSALPSVSAWNSSTEQRIPHRNDSLSVLSLPQLKGCEHLHYYM